MSTLPPEKSHAWNHNISHETPSVLEESSLNHLLSQHIIETSSDCIKLLDLSGRLLYMNQGGLCSMEIDDFERCRLVPWTSLWTGVEKTLAENALTAAREGRSTMFEAENQTAKGTLKWWEVTVTPILDAQEQVINLLSISRDITERKHVQIALQEQARLGALNLAVSVALTQNTNLREMLTLCTQALVDHLDAAFARIWTLDAPSQMLQMQASSGIYTYIDGPYAQVPLGSLKIGQMAAERKPHLTNQILEDPNIYDHDWAKREGMVAFAGYPLLVEGELIGVIAMFARHTLTEAVLSALQSISNAVALGIERKQNDLALLASEERFRTLATQAPIMIWQSDANGMGTFLNATWCTFTGLSESASLGTGWTQAIHPDDRAEAFSLWMQAISTYQPYQTEFRLRRVDGVFRDVLVSGSLYTNQRGGPIGYIGTLLDITERKDLERQRETFISMATHELKTPLTALQGNVQLAQRRVRSLLAAADSLTPHQQTLLEQVMTLLTRGQESVKMQNRLINDLLDSSRALAEKLEFNLSTSDLLPLLQQAVQDQQTAYPQRVITLATPDAAPVIIQMDPQRVKQVISNYLTNALKYSPVDKPVQIGLSSDAASVRVWVQDHGQGLTPEQQEHIWERFYQTQDVASSTSGSPGLGLGLYICQVLIHGQQGEVGVESTKGLGSTFWFSLPLRSL